MTTLISALGISPMVVTETLDELKKRGVRVDKVVVLKTSDPRVETSFYALALDLRWSYKGIELESVDLPFSDIKSQEDHDKFVEMAKEVIRREMKRGEIIISLAGGRKTMGVGLYKAGIELGVKEFYHIIAEEVPGSSNFLKDLISYDIKAVYNEKVNAPESLKKLIQWNMHRKDLTLHLIKV